MKWRKSRLEIGRGAGGLLDRARALEAEPLLFAALVLVHLVPLWAFPSFPSQDGPSHVYNANALREYWGPAFPVVRAYYLLNSNPDPNWFGHLVLAGLMLVVPPTLAEKLFLSAYVVLLPLAVRYALAAVGRNGPFLSLPFVSSYPLHMGSTIARSAWSCSFCSSATGSGIASSSVLGTS